MTIHVILTPCCLCSSFIPNAFICELMILSAACKDIREALERQGKPVMVRIILHTWRMTSPLHDKLRLICIRYRSVHKRNVNILSKVVGTITQIPTVVRVELDLHSIELGVFEVFRSTMLRLSKALEYKSLLLRCRLGCCRAGPGGSRRWYNIDKSGLLGLLQECMYHYNIDILLRYKDLTLNPHDVLSHLGLENIT